MSIHQKLNFHWRAFLAYFVPTYAFELSWIKKIQKEKQGIFVHLYFPIILFFCGFLFCYVNVKLKSHLENVDSPLKHGIPWKKFIDLAEVDQTFQTFWRSICYLIVEKRLSLIITIEVLLICKIIIGYFLTLKIVSEYLSALNSNYIFSKNKRTFCIKLFSLSFNQSQSSEQEINFKSLEQKSLKKKPKLLL